eukprot:403362788
MKLIDPLQGYKIASQIIFLQLAFFLAMAILLAGNEIGMQARDSAIQTMFLMHIWCYSLQFVVSVMDFFNKDMGISKHTITLFTATAFQGAVFYAQVKYIRSSYDEDAEKGVIHSQEDQMINMRSKQWLLIEISFYYTTISLTVLYLVLQSIFKLEIPVQVSKAEAIENFEKQQAELGLSSQTIVDEDPQITDKQVGVSISQSEQPTTQDQDFANSISFTKPEHFEVQQMMNDPTEFWGYETQSQDFLALTSQQLHSFLNFGIITVFSLYILAQDAYQGNETKYKYSMIAIAVLFGILFANHILDQFTKLNFPKWYFYVQLTIFSLVGLTMLYMIVQIITLEDKDSLIRYWILIFLFISVSYFIVYVSGIIGEKLKPSNSQQSTNQDDKEEKVKRTLHQQFMTLISFNVDIYAITFLSFHKLDEKYPRQERTDRYVPLLGKATNKLTLQGSYKMIGQGPTQEIQVSSNETEANKNFSTCAFIFLVQMLLVGLVFFEYSLVDMPSVTFSVFLTRILCAALLHMQLEGEIRQAIQMLQYSIFMVYRRKYRYTMISISLMQLISALATEVISIILICSQDTVQNVIMNFIALGVIAEIDDIYARSLYQNKIKQEIEEGVTLQIDELNPARPEYKSMCQFSFIIYKALRTAYESYYYYFMPFTVIAVSYIKELVNSEAVEEIIEKLNETFGEQNKTLSSF